MSNPALHEQLRTLSQNVAQLEKAIESQIPHLKQPKALTSFVNKIRKSLDAKLIAQTQQQLAECQCKAQQLQQSQQKLFLLMQRNPLAVIEWNARFEVINWNPAAEEMFGYSKSEALGCHVAELLMVES
jgi:PAS domain-containing protein